MNPSLKELPGLTVTLDDVSYTPGLDAPPERPFPFVYFLNIRNRSPVAVTVRGRKWVVRQENGEVFVVEGDGVVGQSPRLEPGTDFTWSSCHHVRLNSQAEGAIFVDSDDGTPWFARIPRFNLDIPLWV